MANSSNTGDQQHHSYRQYNPYHQINLPYRKIYELPTSPQFLFEEEAKKTCLSWSEKLQLYTGSGYLSGSVLGTAKGTLDGIRGAERGESLKLRTNRILNSGGLVARRSGNCLGSLMLMFSALESGVTYLRDGEDGTLTTVNAGFATGSIYRAASGPRSTLTAGALGGVTAFVAVKGKRFLLSRFSFLSTE